MKDALLLYALLKGRREDREAAAAALVLGSGKVQRFLDKLPDDERQLVTDSLPLAMRALGSMFRR